MRDGYLARPASAQRLQSTPSACRYVCVTRDEENAEIAQFLASRGATRCPAAYVAPTSTGLSCAEEVRRLASVQVKKATKQEIMLASHKFYRSLRP